MIKGKIYLSTLDSLNYTEKKLYIYLSSFSTREKIYPSEKTICKSIGISYSNRQALAPALRNLEALGLIKTIKEKTEIKKNNHNLTVNKNVYEILPFKDDYALVPLELLSDKALTPKALMLYIYIAKTYHFTRMLDINKARDFTKITSKRNLLDTLSRLYMTGLVISPNKSKPLFLHLIGFEYEHKRETVIA